MKKPQPLAVKIIASLLALLPLFGLAIPPLWDIGSDDVQYLHQMPLLMLLTPFVAVFMLVGFAVWWLSARHWWWLAIIGSVLVPIGIGFADASQGMILWDGMDAQGNPIGGMIDFAPAPGSAILVGAALAMLFLALASAFHQVPRPAPPAPRPHDNWRSEQPPVWPTSGQPAPGQQPPGASTPGRPRP